MRLVAMLVVPSETTRSRHVARRLSLPKHASAHRWFAMLGLQIPQGTGVSDPAARRPISEKPRIRRDKPVARQTVETPVRTRRITDRDAVRRLAYPPLVHNLLRITRTSSPRYASLALRVSARFRASLPPTQLTRRFRARQRTCTAVDNHRSPDYNSPFVITTIAMSVPAVSASRKRGHR